MEQAEEIPVHTIKSVKEEEARQEALRSLFEEDWEEEGLFSRIKSWWKKRKEKKPIEKKMKQEFDLPEWMHEKEDETVCLLQERRWGYLEKRSL